MPSIRTILSTALNVFVAAFLVSLVPQVAFAQSAGLINPLQASSLPQLLSEILQFIIDIGEIVIVMMLVFIGFKFVAAQGNSEEIASARKALMWTVVGALVLLGSQAIESAIVATINSI